MIRDNLLEVIFDNQDLFKKGLCSWLIRLHQYMIISKEEFEYLDDLLEQEYKIQNVSPLEYLWPSGEISYRIEWLKSKLENK